jgi:D-tyrosyl-tRNA(Tyr) deacylase
VRAVVQRVRRAGVEVGGRGVAAIGPGILALVGVARGDGPAQAVWMAEKLAHLRIFEAAGGAEGGRGRLDYSLLETGGEALVVSQFTLLGDARKGRRPDFTAAAPAEAARPLVDAVADRLRALGVPTASGVFQAHMVISLENDGPVTLVLESPPAPPA